MNKQFTVLVSAWFFVVVFLSAQSALAVNYEYTIGRGKSDITGPAAEVGMMGYGSLDQKTSGIHFRQWARAFVVADPDNGKRVVFASLDLAMIFHGVKDAVVDKLQDLYGSTYNHGNVLLSANHTHAGAGGFSHYALYNITTWGFIEQNFDAIVDGTVAAIQNAHNNLQPGNIYVATGELNNAGVNRSAEAYNANSDVGNYSSNTDKLMTLLRFNTASGDIGMINWFAVHAHSMTNTNTYISGDNKGHASTLFEESKGGSFVAAFAQTNSGDVSANLNGDGTGPTTNEFDNTRILGERQNTKAQALFSAANELITGAVDYRHSFVNFHDISLSDDFNDGNSSAKTCEGALGYSFGAGTEDGEGWGDLFHEGQLKSNVFIDALGWMLLGSDAEMEACQAPKPILLATGNASPYPWTPDVLPLQVVKIGNLVLIAQPSEITTMAGRRLRNQVTSVLGSLADYVVIASHSNHYSGYVTTPEEYDTQHYEGGSTLFGRWTLNAYLQEFSRIAEDLVYGWSSYDDEQPRDLSNEQLTFQTGVVWDGVPIFKSFGDVDQQPNSSYSRGSTVTAKFWTGHPKNDLRTNSTFLKIQRNVSGSWITVATDNDWETYYQWDRIDPIWGTSKAVITWKIPSNAATGTYRIKHYGNWKNGTGKITSFTGTSRSFSVY